MGLVKGWLGAGGTLWEKNRARRARLGQTDVYLQPPEGYKTNSGEDRARDEAELRLLDEARERRLPILCICRGFQVLNVAHQGTLHQDLLQDKVTTQQHKQTEERDVGREKETHKVTIEPDSLLARVMSTTSCSVNSLHHQAVKDVGKGLRVVARSEDNVVEGIELEEDYPFLLAVQWHPEELVHRPQQLRIFERFLAACRNSGG